MPNKFNVEKFETAQAFVINNLNVSEMSSLVNDIDSTKLVIVHYIGRVATAQGYKHKSCSSR